MKYNNSQWYKLRCSITACIHCYVKTCKHKLFDIKQDFINFLTDSIPWNKVWNKFMLKARKNCVSGCEFNHKIYILIYIWCILYIYIHESIIIKRFFIILPITMLIYIEKLNVFPKEICLYRLWGNHSIASQDNCLCTYNGC